MPTLFYSHYNYFVKTKECLFQIYTQTWVVLVKSSHAVLALHNIGLTRGGPKYPRLKNSKHMQLSDNSMAITVETFSPPTQMHFQVKKSNGKDKTSKNIV